MEVDDKKHFWGLEDSELNLLLKSNPKLLEAGNTRYEDTLEFWRAKGLEQDSVKLLCLRNPRVPGMKEERTNAVLTWLHQHYSPEESLQLVLTAPRMLERGPQHFDNLITAFETHFPDVSAESRAEII